MQVPVVTPFWYTLGYTGLGWLQDSQLSKLIMWTCEQDVNIDYPIGNFIIVCQFAGFCSTGRGVACRFVLLTEAKIDAAQLTTVLRQCVHASSTLKRLGCRLIAASHVLFFWRKLQGERQRQTWPEYIGRRALLWSRRQHLRGSTFLGSLELVQVLKAVQLGD